MAADHLAVRRWAPSLIGAIAGLGLAALAAAAGADGGRAWLAASLAILGLPIGALGLSMMTILIPGPWRGPLSAPLCALRRLIAPGAILFLPVLAFAPAIYPWAGAAQATGFRTFYLAPWSFGVRAVALLALFAGLAILIERRASVRVAAAGLLLYVPATTVAAFDWLLSLDPHFASSGFGLYLLCLQMMSALAAAILLSARRAAARASPAVGAVLLTAVLLWAYFAFMQYFIVWSGNLPPGVAWYQRRGEGLWAVLISAAAACRLIPAALLLFPRVRHSAPTLAGLSAAILVGSVLELAWIALPGVGAGGLLLYPPILASMALAASGALPRAPAKAAAS